MAMTEEKEDLRPPARAFAQGVGVMLQTVGVVMVIVSSCLCMAGGLFEGGNGDEGAVGEEVGVVERVHPAQVGILMTNITATVGGLAMAVFGLGMQSDKRYAATGAMVVVVAGAAALVAGGIDLWVHGGPVLLKVHHGLALIIFAVCAPFTVVAFKEVRRQPPERDIDILPPDAKIPYSHLHDDPPEVRMRRELEERRKQLEEERENLDRLERELDADSDEKNKE